MDLPVLLRVAFDPIRQNGAEQPLVMSCLVSALSRITKHVHREEDQIAVLAYMNGVQQQVDHAGANGRGAGGRVRSDSPG